MLPLHLLILILSAGICAAAPSQSTSTSSKSCFDIILPITVTSTNFVWGLPKFANNFDVTNFNTNFNRRDSQTTLNPISGANVETATYNIAGTFCQPSHGSWSTILVATHGLTLDRHYWDIRTEPERYSFVDFVINKGYAVFFYDRLGAGSSSMISGYKNQAGIQVGILEQIIFKIRTGALKTKDSTFPRSPKIVLVGHSYGAALSNALLAINPTVADGAIITGWSFNSGLSNSYPLVVATWQSKIGNSAPGRSSRWAGYDSGYTTPNDIYSVIQTFYKAPFFSLPIATMLHETGWPSSIMEMASVLAAPSSALNSSAFTGPVMFMVGEYDYIMCGGYCPGVFGPDVKDMFMGSQGFEAVIQKDTGHMLTSAHNATGGFGVITDFLAKNHL